MQEVNPLELIPGETYYFETKDLRNYYDRKGVSNRFKAEFVEYEENTKGTSAKIINIESLNDRLNVVHHYHPSTNSKTFHVYPKGSMYTIYKPLSDNIVARKDKELRVKAVKNMINSKFPYPEEDVISTGNMFAEEPFYVRPPTYEETPQKTNIGDQLSTQISKYFGGGRRRKTRKSRKSRKTKSKRRR